ncbi:bacterioferritin [Agaribacterium haliotis]|uniref:bacterioferritin n=1 Tax=Agaribacterium haliotis TaxID=2013869 RepID=UPI000BB57F0C|nr:bacterioferritin [Agaribacterium haliotis]
MHSSDKVVNELNRLLSYELAAMDQYFIHSEMYADWGLSKLAARIGHEFDDEKGHAQKLIARMLFLEGTPDMVTRHPINIGKDVPAMLQSDLDVEIAVGQALREAIAICETEKDYVTRDMLVSLLDDTEVDHEWWLRQQLGLIQKVGLENYIQSQM